MTYTALIDNLVRLKLAFVTIRGNAEASFPVVVIAGTKCFGFDANDALVAVCSNEQVLQKINARRAARTR